MWKCHKCGKPVFFAERKQSLGYDWHPECLRCEECGKRLNPGQHAEHKGVPYCHVPCYGALFGPQLFGHGTKVESHKSFGQAGLARASNGPSLPRDHLESKVKLFNQFYDNKAVIRSREVNGRIVLEGALKVYWGIQGLIHLKEDDDQRTVVTIRKRNSCRYGNSVELSIDSMVQDLSCKDSPDSVEPVMETSIMSLGDGDSTDISLTESMSYDTCSIGEASLGSGNSSKEVSPDHKSNTLPSKLQLKELEWDEMDELLQVERKSDDSSKLYQTMPSPLSTNAGNSDLSEISRGTNTNTTTVTTETYETAPNTNSTNNDEEDTSSSTMKPMDFEDFKKQIQKDYINGANDMQSSRDDTLKSNQPIDPSRINDSLKLYSGDAMSKSYAGETPAMRAQGANSYYLNAGIINANRINDTLSLSSRESSKNYALQKSESAVSPRSGSSIGYEDLDATLTRSKSGPNWCGAYKNGEDFETLKPSTVKKQERPTISIRMNCYTELKNESNEDDATTEPTSTENGDTSMQNLIGSEDSNCEVVLRRPPKTGSVAIKRRSGNKRNRAIKLRRRCSINGHFYNRDTSFFTPPHGSHMSVWVTSLVNTQEVINLILEKYKVESRPQNFALFIIKDNGEQKRLRDDDYPLLVRVLLGPHEDVARIFLMDAQETPEISNEVAQFLNLSFQECRSILDRYNEEMEREAMKIRQKYADLRQHILQRMESLKVRL